MVIPLDLSERLAHEHLSWRFPGEGRVIYESRGRCTAPDFLVDGRIAVEVTLLSEHDSAEAPRPLMESAVPFMNDLRRFANSLCLTPDRSLFVYVDFGRPIPPADEVRRGTRGFLEQLLAAKSPVGKAKRFGPCLYMKCLGVHPVDGGRAFIFGWADRQSGGTPLPILKRNLRLCVDRKQQKLAPIRDMYDEWWLLLTDYVSFTSDYERDGLMEYLDLRHDFDKVLLVDPTDTTVSLEL